MITSDLAQLFQLPPGNGSNQGLFGLGRLLSEGQIQGMINGGEASGELFSGVLKNVLTGDADAAGLLPLDGDMVLDGEMNPEALSPEQLQALEDGESLPGESALIQLTQIITVVYEEFSLLSGSGANFDGLSSTEELAAAYMKAGMSAEEANSRAARLTIMMLVMDNRISTADLMESLNAPRELGLEQKHQSAFIHIEQTISKFTRASAGGNTASLAESIRGGASLQDVTQNLPENAEKAKLILANLTSEVEGNGAVKQSDTGAGLFNADNNNGQQNLLSNAIGRMDNLLNALAEEAAQHPEGADLARQLKEMAGAVQRISQNVVDEGGLQQLEADLPKFQANLNNQNAGLQGLAAKAAKAEADASQTQKVQENIKAQISEEQPLPERPTADRQNGGERSETLLNRGQGAGGENAARNSSFNPAGREPALLEPQTPTYVVRPAAGGGVEVVNPQTGEVVQGTNPAQNAGTPSFSSNTGEASATLTQSRGLEAALQARLNQQVNVHVRNLAAHGGGQINVGLNPPEMGRVQVRLEIMEGSVKGAITVQRPDVAETITRDIRALENAFRDMGLELGAEGISVQLEQNPADQEKDNNNNQQDGSGTHLASNDLSAEEDIQDNEGWINPDRILDVRA